MTTSLQINVIGIGGAGRGVCNHIKYECERIYKSLGNAHVNLICFDGPVTDPKYQIPNKFEINTSTGSPEFYQFSNSHNPTDIIKDIAGNLTENSTLRSWLFQKDAAITAKTVIVPEMGFGGQRTPGHAYISLQLAQIRQTLQNYYNSCNVFSGFSQRLFFLVGSPMGGTGAGTLFDIAFIFNDIIKNDPTSIFSLVMPLPRTYVQIAPDRNSVAKGFASMLNLIRFQCATPNYSNRIYPGQNITDYIELDRLTKVPFIVDGGGTLNYNSKPPQKGVLPQIADMIMTTIIDSNQLNLINVDLVDIAGPGPNGLVKFQEINQQYASFGVSSIIYDWQELLRTFKYRFAYSLYERILSNISSYDLGAVRANDIMNKIRFLTHARQPDFQILPTAHAQAMDMFTEGRGKDIPPPLGRELLAIKIGKLTEEWPPRTWEEVDNDCLRIVKRLKEITLCGWLAHQYNAIYTSFVKEVHAEIQELFYDQQGRARDLKTNPGTILELFAFVERIKEAMDAFVGHITKQKTDHKENVDNGKLLNNSLRDKIRSKNKKSITPEDLKSLRRAHYELYGIYAWEETLKYMQATADAMKSFVEKLDSKIGRQSNGWILIFQTYKDFMLQAWEERLNERVEREEWMGRRYVPKPIKGFTGHAENYIWDEIGVLHLDALMGKMSWNINHNQNKLNDDYWNPLTWQFELTYPALDNYNPSVISPEFENIVKREWLNYTTNYSPEHHVLYANKHLEPDLSNLNIWDILEVDLNAGHMQAEHIPDQDKTQTFYITKITNELISNSNHGLTPNNLGDPDPLRQRRYCFYPSEIGPSSRLGVPRKDGIKSPGDPQIFKQSFLDHFHAHTPGWIYSKYKFQYEIRCVDITVGVNITKTRDYADGLSQYLAYQMERETKPLAPIDIYPNEQKADHLRKVVLKHIDNNFQRIFDPTVINILNDFIPEFKGGNAMEYTDVFEKFSLCYFDKLFTEKDNPNQPGTPRFYYYIDVNGNEIKIAEVWNLPVLANEVMKFKGNTIANMNQLRPKVIDMWKTKWTDMQKQGGPVVIQWLENLYYMAKVQSDKVFIDVDGTRTTLPGFHLEDLKLAMRAAIIDYCVRVLKNTYKVII